MKLLREILIETPLINTDASALSRPRTIKRQTPTGTYAIFPDGRVHVTNAPFLDVDFTVDQLQKAYRTGRVTVDGTKYTRLDPAEFNLDPNKYFALGDTASVRAFLIQDFQ